MYNIKSSFLSILILTVFCAHVLNGMDHNLKSIEEIDGFRLVISRSPSRTGLTEEDSAPQQSELVDYIVERSPSASKDMTDYIVYVSSKVATQVLAVPTQKIYIDFGNKLLNLFKRLNEDHTGQKKQEWKIGFNILGTLLARYLSVEGIKLVHMDVTDFSVEQCFIKPFTDEQKLQRMRLYPEHEWVTEQENVRRAAGRISL